MSKGKLLRTFCLVVMLVCLVRIGQAYILSMRHEARQDELKSMLEGEEEAGVENGQESAESDNDGLQTEDNSTWGQKDGLEYGRGIQGENPILEKYRNLYRGNKDLAGWLTVEGTKIDYPVMQCEDDEYYLHHDFDGQDSKYGCLYVRERADLENGTNFVIYGHNMKDGSMFGELDLYVEEEFYRGHSTVLFSTLFEEHRYEILAVFRSQVYSEDADVFKYYQFYDAGTEEEFTEFYDNIKELSLYDTGVEAEFGDTFLTLSTCAYHVNDGRFVVVAKRVE